jgi:IclR family acetate operon transcriptional repressor
VPAYNIPNLANACRLLRHLGEEPRGRSISQLATALAIPRTTCLRIVQTLAAQGFLSEGGDGWRLGGALIPLGTKALAELDLRALAQPLLKELSEATGETSHVAVWRDGRVLIVAVQDSEHPLGAASRPGTLALAHCSATGKILLAFNHLERLGDVVPLESRERRTARTLVDDVALERELRRVVAGGWAVDNEEYHVGVRCVAGPVRDAEGRVCAAIGITASSARLPATAFSARAAHVLAAARKLSARLGWAAPA